VTPAKNITVVVNITNVVTQYVHNGTGAEEELNRLVAAFRRLHSSTPLSHFRIGRATLLQAFQSVAVLNRRVA
jgi:hypothetical protein